MAEGIGLTGGLEQARGELRSVAGGATTRDRLRMLRMHAHVHLRVGRARRLTRWIPSPPDPPRVVRLRSGLELVCRRSDGVLLYEHFGIDVYGVAPAGPVRSIVDLGANIGFATLALARRYPRARFVCVEPVAESRALLEANLARNHVDAQVFGVAIAGRAGRLRLERGPFAGTDRVHADAGGDIEGITLTELLDRAGVRTVDFLKVDIEGHERELFDAARHWSARVRFLIAELHGDYSAPMASAALGAAGFEALPLRRGVGDRDLACFVNPAPTA